MGHKHHSHSKSYSHDTLTMPEKLSKLLKHWQRHNEEHAVAYRQWADKADSEGMAKLGEIIRSVAEKTVALNEELKQAEAVLKEE